MNVFASLRTALRELRKNKLRSLLAMLGIVIAVGAVVATVSIGQGAQAKVAAQMASLGSNLLMILPGSMAMHGVSTGTGATQTLNRDDANAIEKELTSSVAAVAPISRTGAQIVYENQNWFTQVQGTTAAYLDVRGWPLAQGEPFGREEDAAAAKVCILGKTVVDKLFSDPSRVVGEQIRVKHVPCKIIGVLAAKGQSSWGQDQDDVVVMPWSTVVRRLIGTQSDAVGQLMVSARSPEQVADAQREITLLLRQRHHLSDTAEPDFQIRNLAEMQNAAKENTKRRQGEHQHHRHAAGERGAHLAGGGGHRHRQRHARLGYRAHARDRHPHGGGRARARHPLPVPHRGGGAGQRRRRDGAGDRRRRVEMDGDEVRLADAALPAGNGRRGAPGRIGRRRGGLLSGATRLTA